MPKAPENTLTPASGHEGGKPKNFRYLVAGLVMFILAGAITAASTGIFDRPDVEQGHVQKAPAD